MGLRSIVPLGMSAVLVAVGLALRGPGSTAWPSTLALALGAGLAACVGVFLVVRTIDILRRGIGWVGAGRESGSGLPVEAEQRLHTLIDELTAASEAVERVGLLALADARTTTLSSLFAAGSKMVISAVPAERVRAQVGDTSAAYIREQTTALRRTAWAVQWIAIGALVGSIGFLVAGLFWDDLAPFSGPGALASMLLVYASFMLTVVAQQLWMRNATTARELELAAALIAEGLVYMLAQSGPGVVRPALERLITPVVRSATPATSKPGLAA